MWESIQKKWEIAWSMMQSKYFQDQIMEYIIAVTILLCCIVTIKIFQYTVLRRLKKNSEEKKSPLFSFTVSILGNTIVPLLYFGAFYLSIHNLKMNLALAQGIYVAGILLATFLIIRFFVKLAEYIFQSEYEKPGNKQLLSQSILTVLKIVIWTFGIIFLLDNLGFKISTVIAGLGIGGIAVALAAQTILGDLFNYFVILFDRPFEVGDFIIVGDLMGSVEYIGIKTTRIRSLGGEQLVLHNSDLTASRIRNYKRMERRRIVFKLDVTYQTASAQVREIPTLLKNIIENVKGTQLDRTHFASYGPSSLVYEVVYYVLSGDYNKYMDIQQEINFAIKEEFEKRKIEFAYPSQTVYLKD